MVLYKVIIIWLINGCYWTYEANDDYLKKKIDVDLFLYKRRFVYVIGYIGFK